MPYLSVYAASHPQQPIKVLGWPEYLSATLAEFGVRYVQCFPAKPLNKASSDEEVLEAYCVPVEQLLQTSAGLSVQVLRFSHGLVPEDAPHGHCLDEHSHSEDERHLFVAGQALISLHAGDMVYQLLCERGDLLVIPAGTCHWLDYGTQDNCVVIRVLGSEQGEQVELSGDLIAGEFAWFEG